MTENKNMTASGSSAGTDGKQPQNNTNKSITDMPVSGNPQATKTDDLQTVSMTELYDTAYPPKLPVVDGLLYNGTYLFVGAPKIGKSFFMAQIGYHISMGIPLWGYPGKAGNGALSCP